MIYNDQIYNNISKNVQQYIQFNKFVQNSNILQYKKCNINKILHKYSLHSVLINIFSYDTITKGTKCAYQSSKYNIDFFLLVLQCFNWELLIASAIYCHSPCQ